MNKTLVIAMAAALVFTCSGFAQKTKTTNPGAIVSFDSCAADDAACEAANRVRNDVAGSPYVNGVNGVSAQFFVGSGSYDLVFRLDRSTRTLRFDLRDATYTAGTPIWWYTAPQQNVKPQMNVLGAYNAKLQCAGQPTCNVNLVTGINAGYWSVSGVRNTTYALLWHPTARADRPVNSPELTSAVNVNYIKDSSGERFIITPIPSATTCPDPNDCAEPRYIAGLEATAGRSVTGAGQYNMPFRMTVTLQ